MLALTHNSSYASQHSLPLTQVTLQPGFWADRQAVNRQVAIPHGYAQLESSGNFHNLRLAAGRAEGPYRGPLFMDSDIYKWLEAAAYDLEIHPDSALEHQADAAIELIAATQQPDGYLNSYYQVVAPQKKWQELNSGHELYCAGHFFQAAVAYQRATGKDNAILVARRWADHIDGVFGPGKREGYCGHPEIETALVELYRQTGEPRYLKLAQYFIDARGHGVLRKTDSYQARYLQDRVPIREADVVEGHAVRQLYLTSGATDVYLETGDASLLEAMHRQWHDMNARKMHLIGGYGARHEGESFGDAYELPSDNCYCETCANIAAMMWNWRMLLATGNEKFAGSMERTLYNGFLSGISLDGRRYFYVNPMLSRGGIERPEWYGCACCPPNVMRQTAAFGHYLSSTSRDGNTLFIHQYSPARIRAEMAGGIVTLEIDTRYPWDGRVQVTIAEASFTPFTLAMRIPAWASNASIQLNGASFLSNLPTGSYTPINRCWQTGDTLVLILPMQPRFTRANPRLDAARGAVAIERGPLVYCLEQEDQAANFNVYDVIVDPGQSLAEAWQPHLLGGVITINIRGAIRSPTDLENELYFPNEINFPALTTFFTAVPYFTWANRSAGSMRVWLPTQ